MDPRPVWLMGLMYRHTNTEPIHHEGYTEGWVWVCTIHYNTRSLLLKVSEKWNYSLLIYGWVSHRGSYELLLELRAAAGAMSYCWSYKLLQEWQATVTNWGSDMSWIFIIFNRYPVFSNWMKIISEISSRRSRMLKLSKATLVSENKREVNFSTASFFRACLSDEKVFQLAFMWLTCSDQQTLLS